MRRLPLALFLFLLPFAAAGCLGANADDELGDPEAEEAGLEAEDVSPVCLISDNTFKQGEGGTIVLEGSGLQTGQTVSFDWLERGLHGTSMVQLRDDGKGFARVPDLQTGVYSLEIVGDQGTTPVQGSVVIQAADTVAAQSDPGPTNAICPGQTRDVAVLVGNTTDEAQILDNADVTGPEEVKESMLADLEGSLVLAGDAPDGPTIEPGQSATLFLRVVTGCDLPENHPLEFIVTVDTVGATTGQPQTASTVVTLVTTDWARFSSSGGQGKNGGDGGPIFFQAPYWTRFAGPGDATDDAGQSARDRIDAIPLQFVEPVNFDINRETPLTEGTRFGPEDEDALVIYAAGPEIGSGPEAQPVTGTDLVQVLGAPGQLGEADTNDVLFLGDGFTPYVVLFRVDETTLQVETPAGDPVRFEAAPKMPWTVKQGDPVIDSGTAEIPGGDTVVVDGDGDAGPGDLLVLEGRNAGSYVIVLAIDEGESRSLVLTDLCGERAEIDPGLSSPYTVEHVVGLEIAGDALFEDTAIRSGPNVGRYNLRLQAENLVCRDTTFDLRDDDLAVCNADGSAVIVECLGDCGFEDCVIQCGGDACEDDAGDGGICAFGCTGDLLLAGECMVVCTGGASTGGGTGGNGGGICLSTGGDCVVGPHTMVVCYGGPGVGDGQGGDGGDCTVDCDATLAWYGACNADGGRCPEGQGGDAGTIEAMANTIQVAHLEAATLIAANGGCGDEPGGKGGCVVTSCPDLEVGRDVLVTAIGGTSAQKGGDGGTCLFAAETCDFDGLADCSGGNCAGPVGECGNAGKCVPLGTGTITDGELLLDGEADDVGECGVVRMCASDSAGECEYAEWRGADIELGVRALVPDTETLSGSVEMTAIGGVCFATDGVTRIGGEVSCRGGEPCVEPGDDFSNMSIEGGDGGCVSIATDEDGDDGPGIRNLGSLLCHGEIYAGGGDSVNADPGNARNGLRDGTPYPAIEVEGEGSFSITGLMLATGGLDLATGDPGGGGWVRLGGVEGDDSDSADPETGTPANVTTCGKIDVGGSPAGIVGVTLETQGEAGARDPNNGTIHLGGDLRATGEADPASTSGTVAVSTGGAEAPTLHFPEPRSNAGSTGANILVTGTVEVADDGHGLILIVNDSSSLVPGRSDGHADILNYGFLIAPSGLVQIEARDTVDHQAGAIDVSGRPGEPGGSVNFDAHKTILCGTGNVLADGSEGGWIRVGITIPTVLDGVDSRDVEISSTGRISASAYAGGGGGGGNLILGDGSGDPVRDIAVEANLRVAGGDGPTVGGDGGNFVVSTDEGGIVEFVSGPTILLGGGDGGDLGGNGGTFVVDQTDVVGPGIITFRILANTHVDLVGGSGPAADGAGGNVTLDVDGDLDVEPPVDVDVSGDPDGTIDVTADGTPTSLP